MNTNQITSLIQTVIAGVCGYFVSQGRLDQSTATQITAGVVALMTLVVAHVVHREPPPDPPPAKPSIPLMSLLALLGLSALITGCATTPQQATYQAAGTTIVSVDSAMNLWGDYVAANHPGTNAEAQVAGDYAKYQAAMTVVCDAGEVYAATGGTNNAAALDQAVVNASQEISDLENLISGFGVKLSQ